MTNDDSQPGLANEAVRALEMDSTAGGQDPAALGPNGSLSLPHMAEISEVLLLRAAEHCDEEVATIAHAIRCLRAARGGTSGTSQAAASHLAHHRLKSRPLADARRSLEEAVFRAQDALQPLMLAMMRKMLELEMHQANLERCDAAIARRAQDKLDNRPGVLTQARRVVDSLHRMGVLEGHWSTVTPSTVRTFYALIMADKAAAGVGAPDQPRMDWKRGSGDQ